MFDGIKKWFGVNDVVPAELTRVPDISRVDGWLNPYTGAGLPGVDKLVHGFFDYQPLDQWLLENLYYGNDVARKIIDHIVYDAFREGYTIHVNDEPADDKLLEKMEQLKVDEKVQQVITWSRLYGGAGLLLGVQDMRPLQEEVAEGPFEITYVRPVDKRYAYATFWNEDVQSPDYGDPNVWLVGSYTGPYAWVHTSRFVAFRGIKTDEVTKRRLQGWGFPTLQPVFDVLQGLGQAEHAAIDVLVDMNLDVFSLKGLTQAVAAKRGSVVQERMHAVDMNKSVHKSVLIDADNEKLERHAGNIPAGVGPILDHILYRISCAADMPVSILFGRSPAGMNATGDMDVRIWYDRVKAFQKRVVMPVLRDVIERILASQGVEDAKIELKFKPLYQLTALEQATLEKTCAEKDQIYLGEGVLTPEEVAKSRYGEGEFRMETAIDPDLPREKPVDPTAVPPDGEEPDDDPEGGDDEPPGGKTPPFGGKKEKADAKSSIDVVREKAEDHDRGGYASTPQAAENSRNAIKLTAKANSGTQRIKEWTPAPGARMEDGYGTAAQEHKSLARTHDRAMAVNISAAGATLSASRSDVAFAKSAIAAESQSSEDHLQAAIAHTAAAEKIRNNIRFNNAQISYDNKKLQAARDVHAAADAVAPSGPGLYGQHEILKRAARDADEQNERDDVAGRIFRNEQHVKDQEAKAKDHEERAADHGGLAGHSSGWEHEGASERPAPAGAVERGKVVLEAAERHIKAAAAHRDLKAAHTKEAKSANPRVGSIFASEWDEDKHPRDEAGKFT